MYQRGGKEPYPSIDMEKFGVRLQEACQAKNVSARELKEHLRLASVQAVYLWLGGKRLPSLDNLYAISRYLDVPMDYLIGNERLDKKMDIYKNDYLSKNGKRVLMYWSQLQKEEE